eukprot:36315_1
MLPSNSESDEKDPFMGDASSDKYEQILCQSVLKVKWIIFLTIAEPLLSGSLYPITALYVQSISDTTTAEVSLLMFIGMIYYALSILIYTSLSDKYGHDTLFILSFLFVGIGLLLQAIASHIVVFLIGFFVSKIPTISVGFVYIPTVLPHKYAVRYCALLWTVCSVVYLVGPTIGAFVAHYLSYRAVYYMDAMYHFLCFPLAFCVLHRTVRYLQTQQMDVGVIKHLQKDEQFPVCLLSESTFATSDDSNASHWVFEYISFWKNMPLFDCALLMTAIMTNNATWGIEAIIIFYFILFMISRYSTDIVYSTFMLFALVFMFGLMNLIIPRLIKRVIASYVWIMVVSSFMGMLVGFIAAWNPANTVNCFWAYSVAVGVLLGITSILSEMCILELQPKQHIGKVTGMRDCIKYLFRGASIAVVGSLWHGPNYEALWLGIAVCSAISHIGAIAIYWWLQYFCVESPQLT